MPSRMVDEIADRHPLGEQNLQHALDAGDGDLRRHDVLDQLALLLRQFLDQFLHLAVGEQLRHVGLDQLGEVRGEHGRGVDDGVALDRSFFLERGVDPGRRQAEGRLGGVHAGQRHLIAGRVHDHVLAVPHLAGAGLDLLDLDDIAVGVELHVVEDAHRRHDEAHLDRERAAQRLDLLGQAVGAVGRVDQRQQRIAELDLEIVHFQRRRHRLFGGRRLGGIGFLRLGGDRPLVAAVDHDRRGSPRRRRARRTASSECRAAAP